MTHAARSHDAIEMLQDMRDRIEQVLKAEEERTALREKEEAALHAKLALANACRLLSKIAKQSRVSDGDRAQINGVLRQLEQVA
jgi:uncharacterized protein (UPF0147 family)